LKVLIIEHNQETIKDICFYLQIRYPDASLYSIGQGIKGIKIIESESPDLVILNSSLPDTDHLELIKQIRNFSDVALLILSEVETDVDRARDLEEGADEYVSMPFNPLELLSKVKAILRRTLGLGFSRDHKVSINDKTLIDFDSHEVFVSGKRVKLTPTEYRLFSEMVRNEGRILTYRNILEKVWGDNYLNDRTFIKKYIYRLRSKLESDAGKEMLVSERGIGYRLVKHN
jgi:two-component system, OmpR family, KDP operon response regulator KdpE